MENYFIFFMWVCGYVKTCTDILMNLLIKVLHEINVAQPTSEHDAAATSATVLLMGRRQSAWEIQELILNGFSYEIILKDICLIRRRV